MSSNKTLDDIDPGWFLLGLGTVALIGAVLAIRSGRIEAGYRKLGWWINCYVERDVAPIQFTIRVLLQIALGFALVFFGLKRLLFT
jgi:hypothetical protein